MTERSQQSSKVHNPVLEDKRTTFTYAGKRSEGQNVPFFLNMRSYFLWLHNTASLVIFPSNKILHHIWNSRDNLSPEF